MPDESVLLFFSSEVVITLYEKNEAKSFSLQMGLFGSAALQLAATVAGLYLQ